MTTLQDLLQQRDALAAQQAALEKTLREMQSAERQAAIDKIKDMMAEHGLTVADLSESAAGKTRKVKSASGDARVGKPVAAKYRNNATGESWTGRGLKPKWLTAAIEGGAKIEDFLIAG
ncbi:MAG: H-NS family nucleoid-associated regulatory protein [Leptothrix sp. (in: b-proteobacteria)]